MVAQDIITDPDFDSPRLVFDSQLLPELLGTVIRGREESDSEQYAIVACSRGVWEQPDTSVTDVFIKRFKDIEKDYWVSKESFNRVSIIETQL